MRQVSTADRIVASVVGVALVALTVSVAMPATAYSSPAQLTITPGNPAAENLDGVTFSGECPPGCDAAQLRWDTGSGPVQLPVTLDGTGAFAGLGPYFTGAPPGLGLAVTLDCLQGGTSLGAAYEYAAYPDLGASISGSSTLALSSAFDPVFDCGTAVAPSTFTSASITLCDPVDAELDVISGLPVPSGAGTGLGTPASYGLNVGDVVSLYLNCFAGTGSSPFVAGYRSHAVTITAAAAPPPSPADPPAVPPSVPGSADELAATGIDTPPGTVTGALAVPAALVGIGLTPVRAPGWTHACRAPTQGCSRCPHSVSLDP
jgi:hypothetical protein